jgi:hypothetical protein
LSRKIPGANGPRLNSFGKQTARPDSMSPGDMKVPILPAPRATNRGTMEEARAQMPRPKRPQFTQRYWKASIAHPDSLHGNPDARREIGEG